MDKYDIFVEAGQSNAVGNGRGPVSEPYIPDPRILYLTKPEIDPYKPGTELGSADIYDPGDPCRIEIAEEKSIDVNGGDFALAFAKDYIQAGLLAPDRKLLIIRSAVGGTGFMFNQWEMGAPIYTRMLDLIDYAVSLNPENRLMGMLWHQGEHEAAERNLPQRYHGQLLALIDSVKQRYSIPQMPFICGGFCDEWVQKESAPATAIMQVLQEVAAEHNGIFVQTEDLLSNHQKTGEDGIGDDVHFCRESLHIMGHRYFDAYQKIISRRK